MLVLGLAYKPDVVDDRELPSYEIIQLLRDSGAHADYCDPYFSRMRRTRKHDLGLKCIACAADSFAAYDRS